MGTLRGGAFEERSVWHWVPVILAPVTAAIAVWNLVVSAGEGPLDAAGWARGWVGVAAPLVILATWLWAWRRTGAPYARLALMLVATAGIFAATWSHPGLAGALSFVMPLTWLVAATSRRAMAWTCVIMVAAAAGMLTGGSVDPWMVVFTAAFSLGLSVAIGLSITTLYDQVTQREQLLQELREQQDAVTQLSAEGAAERERAAVLRDVHDAVTQNLTAIVMQARTPGHDAAVIEELAAEALEETRALLLRSAPRQLDQGITTAIARLAERFERETGLKVITELEQVSQPLEAEIVLLRAAQESLANVRRHAKATTVTVRLGVLDDRTVLRVSDDGVGAEAEALLGGSGLRGVRERVLLAGGTCSIDGADGTTVTVSLPEPQS